MTAVVTCSACDLIASGAINAVPFCNDPAHIERAYAIAFPVRVSELLAHSLGLLKPKDYNDA